MTIETDENGYVLLPSGGRSFAQLLGGYVYAMIRADNEATWQAAAEARNLLVRTTLDDGAEVLNSAPHVHISGPMYPVITPYAPEVVAPIAGIVTLVGDSAAVADGAFAEAVSKSSRQSWAVADGATVAQGDVLAADVAAVTDTRPHYNLRIAPWAQETLASDGVTPRWYETLVMFHQGTPITEADRNAAEAGIYTSGITVLDPQTIASPQRVWAG